MGFLPTVCRLAGVNPPASALRDGEDMSDARMGRVRRRTRPLLWENRLPLYGHVLDMSPMLAVRDGLWKLLRNPVRSRVELYDVPHDPAEMNNLPDRNPELVKGLSERLLRWQASLPKGPVDPDAGKSAWPWPQ